MRLCAFKLGESITTEKPNKRNIRTNSKNQKFWFGFLFYMKTQTEKPNGVVFMKLIKDIYILVLIQVINKV